jgi:purine nucleoside transport protein
MYFLINLIGFFVVMGVVFLCSPQKKEVKWKAIVSLVVVELLITWFMLGTDIGSWLINQIAAFFTWLIACASEGIAFVFPSAMANETIDFFFSALLPIIFIVTFFDILSYFGILTWIIDKVGWLISKVSKMPKLESFFSI